MKYNVNDPIDKQPLQEEDIQDAKEAGYLKV